jgi:hydroxyacylglutathione hydrolase
MSMDRIRIQPIPALRDNYIWMMHDGQHAVVVDPGVAAPVLQVLAEQRLELSAVLLTHLHYDHNRGVPGLLERRRIPVFGPLLNEHDRILHPPFPEPGTVPLDCVSHVVGEGDTVTLPALDMTLSVLAVPGHTKGHVVFLERQRDWLFTGDTLFAGGCGKVFGGSMQDMIESLDRLAGLPAQTQIHCAHEYTLANLRFALAVEPANSELAARYEAESRKRAAGLPTLPSTMGMERATNPFLRVMEPQVQATLQTQRGVDARTRVASFEALRSWKNAFQA